MATAAAPKLPPMMIASLGECTVSAGKKENDNKGEINVHEQYNYPNSVHFYYIIWTSLDVRELPYINVE